MKIQNYSLNEFDLLGDVKSTTKHWHISKDLDYLV